MFRMREILNMMYFPQIIPAICTFSKLARYTSILKWTVVLEVSDFNEISVVSSPLFNSRMWYLGAFLADSDSKATYNSVYTQKECLESNLASGWKFLS